MANTNNVPDLTARASEVIFVLGRFYSDAINVERTEKLELAESLGAAQKEIEGLTAKLREAQAAADLARAGHENAKETIAKLERDLEALRAPAKAQGF